MLSTFGSGRALVAMILVWAAWPSVQAAPTFSCDPTHQCIGASWDGETSVGTFGYPTSSATNPTQTYGQTITVPALGDTVLTSFSFLMNLPGVGQDNTKPAMNTEFQAYVFKWGGDRPTGSALFTSPLIDIRTNGYQIITFDTGELVLDTPGTYVLFASILGSDGLSLGGAGNGRWAAGGQGYQGGQFVELASGSWTGNAWATGALGMGGDLAFNASFVSEASSVPEPGSLTLIGGTAIAFAAAVVATRRRCS